MSTNQPPPKNSPEYFYKIALEYYVSGRAALLCGNTSSLATSSTMLSRCYSRDSSRKPLRLRT